MKRIVVASTLLAGLLVGSQAWACPMGKSSGWCSKRFEIGPRISHLTLTDVETDQNLPMGGLGGYLRYRFGKRFGLEGALDIMVSDELGMIEGREGEVSRVTVPLTGSALFYLFPNSRFQMYFLGGLGVAGHHVAYDALGESTSFGTPLAQLGIGGVWRGERMRFDFSLRSMRMWRKGEDIEVEPLTEAEIRPVEYEPLLGDRVVDGAMLTIGVAWGIGR